MVQFDRFFRLVEGIFMPVNLGKNGAELHLESCDDNKFSHAVANRFLF